MKQTYYDYLKDQINESRFESENLDKTVLYLPDFFRLLCELLDEDIIYEGFGAYIRAALAYFVIPNDIIPEELYGIAGYMDDLYICCVVLKDIYDEYPEVIDKNWSGEEEFAKILDLCYFKSLKVLEEQNLKDRVLDFAGLLR